MVNVLAPFSGRALPLSDVPDPVFSTALVGPGAAAEPTSSGRVIAGSPVSGRIRKLHPHAFVVVSADGAGVLVHLGIDTVQLAGNGFELLATEGGEVVAGDPMVAWWPEEVRRGGRSVVSPVIALDARPEALSDVRVEGQVAAGEPLFVWIRA
ncbi:MAG: PTS glucose transporter subunit IIA [Jiangellaceae bacterium]|nr:PTS glucose transporter subunit IIA [Jiangellaceae bacterium]